MGAKVTTDINQGKGYGFRSEDGKIYMLRCFECGQENWAPAVASGQCAWCGYRAKEKKRSKNAR